MQFVIFMFQNKGHAGRVTLSAEEFQQPALGYVLELSIAGQRLYEQLALYTNISHFCPAKLTACNAIGRFGHADAVFG